MVRKSAQAAKRQRLKREAKFQSPIERELFEGDKVRLHTLALRKNRRKCAGAISSTCDVPNWTEQIYTITRRFEPRTAGQAQAGEQVQFLVTDENGEPPETPRRSYLRRDLLFVDTTRLHRHTPKPRVDYHFGRFDPETHIRGLATRQLRRGTELEESFRGLEAAERGRGGEGAPAVETDCVPLPRERAPTRRYANFFRLVN